MNSLDKEVPWKGLQLRIQEAHSRLEKDISKAEGFRSRVMLSTEDAKDIANFLTVFAYD